MTKEEIKKRFEAGEQLTMSFSIRKNYFEIGGSRITEKQFDAIRKEYSNNLSFRGDYGGFTRHHYTYKP